VDRLPDRQHGPGHRSLHHRRDLAGEWGGGLYWLAPTALLGIVGAVYNVWVLLAEIVR
jgi:hypothetical protein